jgi:hypothetical protein
MFVQAGINLAQRPDMNEAAGMMMCKERGFHKDMTSRLMTLLTPGLQPKK